MPLFRTCPFEELVVQATNEKNVSDNWELILDICDKAVNYEEGPKLILQAVAKRLYSNVPRVVIQALLLLDACVKNCGKRFHLEVSSRNFVLEIQKLLQKMHPCTVDKLKSLVKKWAETEFKDDPELGLIPSLYYQLKSEGVQFPEEITEKEKAKPMCTNPDAVSSQEEEEDIVKAIALSLKETHRSNTISSETFDGGRTSQPVRTELCKVRTLYDFEAAEDNELTIKAGEIIVVIDKSNDSWWKGTNQRGEGYFPVSFVTEDLNAEIELEKVEDGQSEAVTEEEEVIEKAVVIDEAKIHLCLELLTEAGPTDKYPDDDDVLALEQECHTMASLVEDKLQEIDKKFTVLDSLNVDIMKAIQTYNRLTRESMGAAQHVYYYTVPADGVAENQQSQEMISSQSSSQRYATVPHVITKHSAGPVPDNTVHMSSGPYSHPTNLSSAQMRANLMNATFPPQSNLSHYVTLPYKSSADHPTVQPGLSVPNIPSTSMSYQVPVKINVLPVDGNAKPRTVIPTGLPISHENLAVLTSGVANNTQQVPVFFHYPNTPGVMRNVIFSGNVPAAHIRPAMTDVSQVSPLNQPVGSAITQTTTSVLEAAPVEVSKHDMSSELSNTSAVVTNAFSESAVLPSNVATPVERYPGNVMN